MAVEPTNNQPETPSLVWTVVAGPPSAGKAALADKLATEGEPADVFRFRQVARALGAPTVSRPVDPRGEYPDSVVYQVLTDALLRGRFPASHDRMLLPGFPATVTHLRLLHTVAQRRGARLRVIGVDAENVWLVARAYHHQVCLTCQKDEDLEGQPHLSAPGRNLPTICDTCGQGLWVRACNEFGVLFNRITAYRVQWPALVDLADRIGVPWQHLDTTRMDPDMVAAVARRLLATPAEVTLARTDRKPADTIPDPRTALDDLL